MSNKINVIGKRQAKKEAYLKATGALKFTGDLSFPGMLYCKILRSPHAHAYVRSIDISEALKMPGVVDIITHDDVPKILSMHQFLHTPEAMYYDSYLLEKHVRHVGDRVAAVAATSLEAAEDALEKIIVDYEVVPAVFTPEDAMADGAPAIHTDTIKGLNPITVKNNILDATDVSIGDTEKGFLQSDVVIERTYRTSVPNNAMLELTAVVVSPRPDGRIDVYCTGQGVHSTRMNISNALGIPVSQLNVHRMFLGGSFGAHIHTGFIENICTFLAMRTGRPVRGEKTREEIFLSCGRHPMVVRVKAGFKKDGTMMALHSDTTDVTGSYAFSGSSKMNLTAGFSLSMYQCPNLRMSGRSVYVNLPPLTAMRGAGNPQANWSVENFMNDAADELGIDPIELRKKNNLGVGDIFYGQGPKVKAVINSCGTVELLDRGSEIMDWKNRDSFNRTPDPDRPWIKRGLGMARGFHTSGCGSEKPNDFIIDHSAAFLKMNEDGTAQLMNAACDMGSGVISAHAALIADTIGLKYEDVIVNPGDSDTTPFDGPTHASRGLYGSGQPVVKCAQIVKAKLLQWSAQMLGTGVENVEIKNSMVYNFAKPEEAMHISKVVQKAHFGGWGTATAEAAVRPHACPPHFVVIFAEVEVDTRTGKVSLERVLSGVDTGTVINLQNVEGQMEGGIHMGAGYALMEDTIFHPETGAPLNANFADYKILSTMDMPRVEKIIANTYEPTGPFGAKAIGEGVTNPVPAAINDAIWHAVGVRVNDLPVSPEKLLNAMREKGAK